MRKNTFGFTIVELMVVIVVVGVIAAISTLAYVSIQNSAQDSDRETKANLIAEALEKSFRKRGEYPGCSALTNGPETVSKTALEGIDKKSLTAPLDQTNTNSISCDASVLEDPTSDKFVFVGDGSSTCASDGYCRSFIIRYRQSDGTIKEIESRGNSTVASELRPELVVTDTTNNSVSLSWDSISGATGYTLSYATNADLAGSTNVNLAAGATSYTVSSLSSGTTYYFGLFPRTPADNGVMSDIVSATLGLSAPTKPTLAAEMSGNNAVGTSSVVSCSDATTEYRFRMRKSATSSYPAWSAWSSWGTSRTATQAGSQGWEHQFQVEVRCRQGANSSNASISGVAAVVMAISAPSQPTLNNTTSGNNTTWTWNNASCPAGSTATYNKRFSSDGNNVPGTLGGWTTGGSGTSSAQNTSYQGVNYSYSVQARCESPFSTSSWSGTASSSYLRPITAPGAPTLTQNSNASGTTWNRSDVSCGAGTTATYQNNGSNDGVVSEADFDWQSWSGGANYWVSTSIQGVEYVYKARARCESNYTSRVSGYGSTATLKYLRPISRPSTAATTFSVSYPLATQVRITSTPQVCSGSTLPQVRMDVESRTVPIIAGPPAKYGWYNQGNANGWLYNGFELRATPSSIIYSGSTIPKGAQFRAAFQYRCYQPTTFRAGDPNSAVYSPIYSKP